MCEVIELPQGNPWLEAVRIDNSINFIAIAYTPWHAISIDSLILKLQSQGEQIKASIVLMEHPSTGWSISKDCFINNCSIFYKQSYKQEHGFHSVLISNVEKRSIINHLKDTILYYSFYFRDVVPSKNKRKIYFVVNSFFQPCIIRELHYSFGRHVIVSYSEEGVASYMGTIKSPYSSVKDIHAFSDLKKYLKEYLLDQCFYTLLHKTESVKILKKSWNQFKIVHSVIPFYTKVLEAISEKSSVKIEGKNRISESILICTTAWERKKITAEEDLRVLSIVCSFLKGQGYNLLLKTHPRDSYFEAKADSLFCSLVKSSNASVESICIKARPIAIISFSSTTLITPHIFWNIPVFCISDMLDRSKIDDFYLKEIDSFKNTFLKIVNFPQSEKDIII